MILELMICRLGKVDWSRFGALLSQSLESMNDARTSIDKYSYLTGAILRCVEEAGAYVPKFRTPHSPVKPSWWTEECDRAIGGIQGS